MACGCQKVAPKLFSYKGQHTSSWMTLNAQDIPLLGQHCSRTHAKVYISEAGEVQVEETTRQPSQPSLTNRLSMLEYSYLMLYAHMQNLVPRFLHVRTRVHILRASPSDLFRLGFWCTPASVILACTRARMRFLLIAYTRYCIR